MAVHDAVDFDNRIIVVVEPETICVLSGENATDETLSECPCRGSPMAVLTLHPRIQILSCEPETMRVPSGENATEDKTESECPCRGSPMAVPDAASHNRIVLSSEPETMHVPSGENATDETESECPRRGPPMAVPNAASHNRIESCQARPRQCVYCQGRMQRMRPSEE